MAISWAGTDQLCDKASENLMEHPTQTTSTAFYSTNPKRKNEAMNLYLFSLPIKRLKFTKNLRFWQTKDISGGGNLAELTGELGLTGE